jgi:hypothetical protein
MMETSMAQNTKEQLWADWMATQDIGRFSEILNAQTEDSKYKILAQLLSNKLEKLKKAPRR